ncbi:MAG: Na+/H+ antiporter subunit E [Acidimicrobiales bacterium]|nr:Na+/H+ antiporter subunit E [Acidimicrobiales bacterium]
MSARLLTVGWLTAVWVALWGGITPANVLSGLVAAGLVLTAFPIASRRPLRINPLWGAVLVGWFLAGLVRASATVAWQVIRPRSRLRPTVLTATLPALPPALRVLMADAVSLTPGTLTLDLIEDPPALHIHVLDGATADSVQRDVDTLARLVQRAFPPSGASGDHRAAMADPRTRPDEGGRR